MAKRKRDAEGSAEAHMIPTVLDRVRDRLKVELVDRMKRNHAAALALAESFAKGEISLASFLTEMTSRRKEVDEMRQDLACLESGTAGFDGPTRVGPILDLLESLGAKVATDANPGE
jgi:hypothetical protein